MTAVIEIIDLCLKDIGMVGEGQTASDSSIADAFATLKQMLGQWQADKLYVYAQKEIITTPTGAVSYSVGPGADVDVPRPLKIDSAFWRSGAVDYPVVVFHSLEDYARITLKSSGAMLAALCYVPTFPLGTLYVYPQTSAGGELHMITRIDLPVYESSYDDLAVPPEYAMAIRYSLDEHLSTTFQTPLRPDIPALAQRARKVMKRNNISIPLAQMPPTLMRGRRSDIRQF
jgi:hypothetical protein